MSRQTLHMDRIIGSSDSRGTAVLILSVLALAGVVGVADARLARDLSLLPFYLVPIFLATLSAGRLAGTAVSTFCAVLWFIAHRSGGPGILPPAMLVWNTCARLVIFLIFMYFVSAYSALKQALRREQEQARTDFLTGTLNLRAFADAAELEIRRSKRHAHHFSVISLNLDDFQAVNDGFGRQAGDALLRAAADTLKHTVRSSDTVARLGGDEYVILLPETGVEGAVQLAKKCQQEIHALMPWNGWAVTASVGVVTFMRPPESFAAMLEHVAEQMHKAKMSGNNVMKNKLVL